MTKTKYWKAPEARAKIAELRSQLKISDAEDPGYRLLQLNAEVDRLQSILSGSNPSPAAAAAPATPASAAMPPAKPAMAIHAPVAPTTKPDFSKLHGLEKSIAVERWESAQKEGQATAPSPLPAPVVAPCGERRPDFTALFGMEKAIAVEKWESEQARSHQCGATAPPAPRAASQIAPAPASNLLLAAAFATFGDREITPLLRDRTEAESTKLIENRFVMYGLDGMIPSLNFSAAKARVQPLQISGFLRAQRAEQIERLEKFLYA